MPDPQLRPSQSTTRQPDNQNNEKTKRSKQQCGVARTSMLAVVPETIREAGTARPVVFFHYYSIVSLVSLV